MQANSSIARGALITVAMRWVDRLIGLLSTMILARLLVPNDFGIIAMASIAVAFVDIIFDLGVNVALIQNRNPTQSYYNTAWTLRILQSTAVAAVVFLLAPYAGEYYHDSRVIDVIRCLALGLVISSFENIGTISFQKNLNFAADFKLVFLKKISGFVVTMILTLIFRNYWGMVLGGLCGRMIGVVASYLMHKMRPKFSLIDFSGIFSVSQWVLVRNISQYLNGNLHVIIVGGFASSSQTGGYTMANEISNLPGTELLAPINRVLFPAFVRAKDNMVELKNMLLHAQSLQVLVTAPACVGLVLTAREFVPVALGPTWVFVIPLIQILAFSNIIQSIGSSGNYVLIALGKIRFLAIISWFQIAIFLAGFFAIGSHKSIEIVAAVRLLAIGLSLWCTFVILIGNIPGLSVKSLAATTIRPAVGCAAMAAALLTIDVYISLSLVPLLITKILVGAVVYIGVVIFAWHLAGRPPGAETYILEKAKATIAGRRSAA